MITAANTLTNLRYNNPGKGVSLAAANKGGLVLLTAGRASQDIFDAVWEIIIDCGETEGLREWPEGSGQVIWWKGAKTGDGCEFASYGDEGYYHTVKSGIAVLA